MNLSFERGNPREPKGHALAYFTSRSDATQLYATYLVVPPIAIELAKYMPAMFAPQMAALQSQSVAAIPLPPLPEAVPSLETLRRLADLRDDDLVYAGSLQPDRVEEMLTGAAEAAQTYFNLHQEYAQSYASTEPAPELEVSDVLYGLMPEGDRLRELVKLTGKLRYGMEGKDQRIVKETIQEMEALGRHLPEKYRLAALIEAANIPGERGQQLCELYVQRCFLLCEEKYQDLAALELKIQQLQQPAP